MQMRMVCRTLYVSSSRYVCLFLRLIIIMASCFRVFSVVFFFSNSRTFFRGLFLSTGFMFRGVGQKSVFIRDYVKEIRTWAWDSPNFWEHARDSNTWNTSPVLTRPGNEAGSVVIEGSSSTVDSSARDAFCVNVKRSCRQRFLSREAWFFLIKKTASILDFSAFLDFDKTGLKVIFWGLSVYAENTEV